MTDYVGSLWCQLNDTDEMPEEFTKKREAVLAKLKDLDEKSKKMLELLENDEVIGALRSDKLANMQYLKENFDVTVEMVDSLYDFGQCQYSCGSYATAADLLYQFRILVYILPLMVDVVDCG